jgi:hypothetical protein
MGINVTLKMIYGLEFPLLFFSTLKHTTNNNKYYFDMVIHVYLYLLI